jgi:DNA-binding transcriptional LysR family regulator
MQDTLLNRLKLKPLLIFSKVLQYQSIVHAAGELNLTQSTTTKAIQELEAQLGVELFERTNRGMRPTECALLLGERVKGVLAELRYLTDEIAIYTGGGSGHVIVGTLLSASAKLLPEAILSLKQEAPNILVTVQVGTTAQLFQALAIGEIDMVVGRLPDEDSSLNRQFTLKHEVLYDEQLKIMVGSQHPLLAQATVDYTALREYPWILPPTGSALRQVITQFFRENAIAPPDDVIESVSLLTNLTIMQSSPYICFMPTMTADKFIQSGLLASLPFGEVGEQVGVGISTYSTRRLSPVGEKLITHLRRVVVDAGLSG